MVRRPLRTALVAGATGLVGRELLRQLGADPACTHVVALLRRPVPELAQSPKVDARVVDFAALPTLPRADEVYVALGTTLEAAGSQEAFRRVDHDHVVAVARGAHVAGARRIGVVSALGADRTSRVFYNRVKGEMEAGIAALGYDCVVFAQPSLLLGDRAALGQPERGGERLATRLAGPGTLLHRLVPAAYRPIAAADVAAALRAALHAARPGVHRLASAAMQGAAAR